jgi:hypothetical protein
MKKRMITGFLIVLCILLLTGCVLQIDGDGDVSLPQVSALTEAVEDIAASLEGEQIEKDGFSMTAPKGWNQMDIQGGVQLYKGSDVFQISVDGYNVSEEEDKALLQGLVDRYDGTEITTVEMLGMTFYTSSFTASGVEQTFYSAVRDGEQIHIQLGGNNHSSNAELQAMLRSVQLK